MGIRNAPSARSARVTALAALVVSMAMAIPAAAGARPRVLLVGTFHGKRGAYPSIPAAVRAAHAGDYILIAPGDYKTTSVQKPAGANGDDRAGAAVLITKADLHLIGLNRNTVIVDGTKPGTPPCASSTAAQSFGPNDPAGKPGGLNGIIVYKATGVTVENLTACNFLTGDLGGGNAIWFDGGAATAHQTAMAFTGSWLSATSSYFVNQSTPAGAYGIYSSNTSGGPGLFAHDYASNQNDSGYYVGACPDCQVTLDGVRAEYNVLGYSGTNSGGHVLVQNSEFDNNQDGFDTNSQNNDDAPSPQNGACPGATPASYLPAGAQQAHSCWVFVHNYVHDNNNPNVPSRGAASYGPVGTGLSLSGARNDIVADNRFVNNGAWGVLVVPYPDTETPPPEATDCLGGTPNYATAGISFRCLYDDYGNEVFGNTFTHNGFYGNPTNGDVAELGLPESTANCFHANTDTAGALTSDPPNLQSVAGTCGQPGAGDSVNPLSTLAVQAICDTQLLAPCPSAPGMAYPRVTTVVMRKLAQQPAMPNPCQGVPANAWCSKGHLVRA